MQMLCEGKQKQPLHSGSKTWFSYSAVLEGGRIPIAPSVRVKAVHIAYLKNSLYWYTSDNVFCKQQLFVKPCILTRAEDKKDIQYVYIYKKKKKSQIWYNDI